LPEKEENYEEEEEGPLVVSFDEPSESSSSPS
jgi:hypothetical protein